MKNLSLTTRQELINTIIDTVTDGRLNGQEVSETHHEIFNTDYYIIGTYQAEEWLKNNFGIFAAIDTIKEYEQYNFGEVTTDLSNAENVVNMLVYILGENILHESEVIQGNWSEQWTEDILKDFQEELENM